MTAEPVQITARGPRAVAEAAAVAVDETPATEALTYSILEEDEDHDVWRIDAFPTTVEEQAALVELFAGYPELRVATEKLADADWLAMSLSGLP
ncbi:MAG: 50S ribosomal protein L11 methyltransferase, partial [Phenylobacterium sp.]